MTSSTPVHVRHPSQGDALMNVLVDGTTHRVHVRQEHMWIMRCGRSVDPWSVDEVRTEIGRDPCPGCGARRPYASARRAKAKLAGTKPPPGGATAAASSKSPPRTKTSAACHACQKSPRVRGLGGYCRQCAIRLLPVCRACGKLFSPPKDRPNAAKCTTCRRKPKGSAWVVASAGAPSLGRRA